MSNCLLYIADSLFNMAWHGMAYYGLSIHKIYVISTLNLAADVSVFACYCSTLLMTMMMIERLRSSSLEI